MIPDDLFGELCHGARCVVLRAYFDAHRSVAPSIADEIDHLIALAAATRGGLASVWSPVLGRRRIAIRLTGVICHQTPKAQYTHPQRGNASPELADLLIVHDHNSKQGQSRRAVLVQVKRTASGIPNGSANPDQEYLYKHWPLFKLKGCGPGKATFLVGDRDLTPNKAGSRYGLVEGTIPLGWTPPFPQAPCFCMPWWFADPRGPIRTAGGEDTGAFMTNMLFKTRLRRGRDAVPIPPTASLALSKPPLLNNHFDITVEELLRVTAKRTLHFKRKSHVSGTRGDPHFVCFQSWSGDPALLPSTGGAFLATDGDGGGGGEGPPEEEPAPEEGISTILIETGSEA